MNAHTPAPIYTHTLTLVHFPSAKQNTRLNFDSCHFYIDSPLLLGKIKELMVMEANYASTLSLPLPPFCLACPLMLHCTGWMPLKLQTACGIQPHYICNE